MQFESVKKWWPLACFLSALWLAAYIAFWLDRTDCTAMQQACLYEAFGNWLGDVVMLQWVKSYQALVGGLLAAAAASAIIATPIIERQHRQAEARQIVVAQRRQALAEIDLSLRALSVSLSHLSGSVTPASLASLSHIEQLTRSLNTWAQPLAYFLGYIIASARSGLAEDDAETVRQTRILMHGAAMALSEPERLVNPAGELQISVYKPAKAELANLQHEDLSENDRTRLAKWVDLTKQDD